MFEMMLLSFSIHLINSIFGGIYTGSFLKEKYRKKITLVIWIVIYLLSQIAIFEIIGSKYQINDIVEAVVNICILFFCNYYYLDKTCQNRYLLFSVLWQEKRL